MGVISAPWTETGIGCYSGCQPAARGPQGVGPGVLLSFNSQGKRWGGPESPTRRNLRKTADKTQLTKHLHQSDNICTAFREMLQTEKTQPNTDVLQVAQTYRGCFWGTLQSDAQGWDTLLLPWFVAHEAVDVGCQWYWKSSKIVHIFFRGTTSCSRDVHHFLVSAGNAFFVIVFGCVFCFCSAQFLIFEYFPHHCCIVFISITACRTWPNRPL